MRSRGEFSLAIVAAAVGLSIAIAVRLGAAWGLTIGTVPNALGIGLVTFLGETHRKEKS